MAKGLLKGMNPTIYKLGFVSFLGDIASEMLFPITPIFLTTVLGAPMATVGLIEGLAEAVSSILKTASGYMSDKVQKRKPFIFVGYLLSALSKPMVGFAYNWIHVIIARSGDRVGKGLRTAPRDALISECVQKEYRGLAFGWHRAMDTMGAAMGSLTVLFLLPVFNNDLRKIFYIAIIPGLISALLVLTIKDSPHILKINPEKIVFKIPGKDFLWFIFIWGVFSITSFSEVFILMKTKDAGFEITHTILFYFFMNIVFSLLSPWFGDASDKRGRKAILIFGLSVFVITYTGFAFAHKWWELLVLFCGYGLYKASTDGVAKAYAVDLAPHGLKATAVGIYNTSTGLCSMVAGVICGLIWDHHGSQWCFLFGAIGALFATLLLTARSKKII